MSKAEDAAKRIIELAGKATPEPWSWHMHGGDFLISNAESPDRKNVMTGDLQFYNVPFDAVLIAESRTLAPKIAEALLICMEWVKRIHSYGEVADYEVQNLNESIEKLFEKEK